MTKISMLMKTVAILCIILAITIPFYQYFTYVIGPETTYNRTFGSHATMAYDQSTFEGMREQIMIIWTTMNSTWPPEVFNITYNTWWGPSQNYENSLAAENDYFRSTIRRIDNYIGQYNMLLNSSTTILLQDWYDQAIRNLRNETQREGGLLWAIDGAYFLSFAPFAYWAPLYFGLEALALFLAAIGLWVLASYFNSYAWKHRHNE